MRSKRTWHPDFVEYMKYIVGHENYMDLPNKFRGNGEILWVSPSDKKRAVWWDQKVKKLNCINRAEVARKIHPKELQGLKPCQICGKKLSIFYIYPNANSLKKLNVIKPQFQFTPFKEDIADIVGALTSTLNENGLNAIREAFDVPQSVGESKDKVVKYIKKFRKSKLSPGVMSNPPDRLDGFHTYNACCRSKEDTGRHSSNLARYTQDRRVYENWAEGNWNLSNRIMGEFNRYDLEIKCPGCGKIKKMTADHIGPISLGFTHRPKFNPLCNSCNSSKNNRMFLKDVKELLKDESKGEQVISWHSKFIWDLLKNKVKSQEDALKLSRTMRNNLHHILILFSKISEAGFDSFLEKYLHPEYSYVDYRFINFHPQKGPEKIQQKPLTSANKIKNANRYIRVAFESLEEYKNVENRNTKIWKSDKVEEIVKDMLTSLSNHKESESRVLLNNAIQQLSMEAASVFDIKS